MYVINKRFKGYPFAHRQWKHRGHCKLVHGHNWDFEVCIGCTRLDDNGFVFDFGKFKDFKKWLELNFDHTCVINEDDPQIQTFQNMDRIGLLDLRKIKSCSSEGIAKYIYEQLQSNFEKRRDCAERGIKIRYVRVFEDHKNTATYYGD